MCVIVLCNNSLCENNLFFCKLSKEQDVLETSKRRLLQTTPQGRHPYTCCHAQCQVDVNYFNPHPHSLNISRHNQVYLSQFIKFLSKTDTSNYRTKLRVSYRKQNTKQNLVSIYLTFTELSIYKYRYMFKFMQLLHIQVTASHGI